MDQRHSRNNRRATSTPPGRPALLRLVERAASTAPPSPPTLRDLVGRNDWQREEIEFMASIVGGIEILESLDADPLPLDEPFDDAAIDTTDLPTVASVLTALHEHRSRWFELLPVDRQYRPAWLAGEYATVIHRLIARAARVGVSAWPSDPRRAAAVFVWIALAGNYALGRGHVSSAPDIWRWYDVNDSRALAARLCVASGLGSVTTRAERTRTMFKVQAVLGDATVIHSSFRRFLAHTRDRWLRSMADHDQARAAQQPVQLRDDGNLAFRACQLQPLWSMKAMSETGRAAVMIAFGVDTEDDDYQLIGMNIPDVYELIRQLHEALDAPMRATVASDGRSG